MSNRVQSLLRELETAIREQVRAELSAAMSSALGNGRPPVGRPAGSRGRRGRADLAQTAEAILKHLAKNPDSRAEQLADALGAPTKTLVGPLKQLMADKSIKRKGKARGTTYALA
jgi:hypothetical protein